MRVQRLETIYLWLAGVMLALFSIAIAISVYGLGMGVPGVADAATPDEIASLPGFDEPGLREISAGRYEAYMLVEAWEFTPDEITVPAGSEVAFFLASTDIVHSFKVFDTTINVTVIPGYISEVAYTFDEPGDYMFICGEFCGTEHHTMTGVIHVMPGEEEDGDGE